MAGLYIHVPFCQKICSYCDFYKTTAISLLPEYLSALGREMAERAAYLEGSNLDTIYFGGGTPSLIPVEEMHVIFSGYRRTSKLLPTVKLRLKPIRMILWAVIFRIFSVQPR